MPYGYAGRILWIDLTGSESQGEAAGDRYDGPWVGGHGSGSLITLKNKSPRVDAFAPVSILGFTTGLRVGFLPGATRCGLAAGNVKQGKIAALRSQLRRIFAPPAEQTLPLMLAHPLASRGECARGRIQKDSGKVIASDLHNPHFVELAESHGAVGMPVETPEALASARVAQRLTVEERCRDAEA